MEPNTNPNHDDLPAVLFVAMMLNLGLLIEELHHDGHGPDRIIAACDELIWETEGQFPAVVAEHNLTAGMPDAVRQVVGDLF